MLFHAAHFGPAEPPAPPIVASAGRGPLPPRKAGVQRLRGVGLALADAYRHVISLSAFSCCESNQSESEMRHI